MERESVAIAKAFKSDLANQNVRELFVRLMYVEMLLGSSSVVSFAKIAALKAVENAKDVRSKQVAYLALSAFMTKDDPEAFLLHNTLAKDLGDKNYVIACLAVTAFCRLMPEEQAFALFPQMCGLIHANKETTNPTLRKRAVMALQRLHQLNPQAAREVTDPETGWTIARVLREALCDKHPGVMAATLCVLHTVAVDAPGDYRNVAPSLVAILQQVLGHKLPPAFDYKGQAAPFLQIRLLRIMGVLGRNDASVSQHLYPALEAVLKHAKPTLTIGQAVLLEAVRTVIDIHPHLQLIHKAGQVISNFLTSSVPNLRYAGLALLTQAVAVNPGLAGQFQLVVVDCLSTPDTTMRLKALELLTRMANSSNVEVIVEKLFEQLAATTDDFTRLNIVRRTNQLAVDFAPDYEWYIVTMSKLLSLSGDRAVAADLLQLASEQVSTAEHLTALSLLLELLSAPGKKSDALLCVVAWVAGEFGCLGPQLTPPLTPAEVMDKLAGVAAGQACAPATEGFLLSAVTKLCVHAGMGPTPGAAALFKRFTSSRDAGVQQLALQMQELLRLPAALQQQLLPFNAASAELEHSQEDIRSLSFAQTFVDEAQAAGAAPYASDSARAAAGPSPPSSSNKALRYDTYAAPSAAAPAQPPPPAALDPGFAAAGTPPPHLRPEGEPAPPSAPKSMAFLAQGKAQKWGTPQMAPPSPSPAATAAAATWQPSTEPAGRVAAAAQSSPPQERPSDLSERQQLAASLFGGGRTSRPTSGRTAGRVGPAAGATPPPPPLAAPAVAEVDLLGGIDLLGEAEPESEGNRANGVAAHGGGAGGLLDGGGDGMDLLGEVRSPAPAQPSTGGLDDLLCGGEVDLMSGGGADPSLAGGMGSTGGTGGSPGMLESHGVAGGVATGIPKPAKKKLGPSTKAADPFANLFD